MSKPVAALWYGIQPQDGEVLRLHEIHIDPYLAGDIWLLRGEALTLAIDCGTGMVSPRPLLDALSDRPVMAVALNCYYDHAGGLYAFDRRACHAADAEAIAHPTARSSVADVFVSDTMLRALPEEGYRAERYAMRGAVPTELLDDGDIIELGGRILKVLHVPGVTPGSLALWEPATGSLFTSDTLFEDPLARVGRPQNPEDLASSLKRLRALPVERVFGGHYGSFGPARMQALIERQLAALD